MKVLICLTVYIGVSEFCVLTKSVFKFSEIDITILCLKVCIKVTSEIF